MRHFLHSGDLGDIVYALPAVRAMGGGVIHLIDVPQFNRHGMTPQRAALIAPLLTAQPYIHGVQYNTLADPLDVEDDQIVNLNWFRQVGHDLGKTHLADCVSRTFNLPDTLKDEAWLEASPVALAPVVIARSPRYHNRQFPWPRIVEKYAGQIVFVGTKFEHNLFVNTFGPVPRVNTPTLLDVARLIAGARLFIGNQSCPLAIAEGLKQNLVLEVCDWCPNCKVDRPGAIQGWNEAVELPDLDSPLPAPSLSRGECGSRGRRVTTHRS